MDAIREIKLNRWQFIKISVEQAEKRWEHYCNECQKLEGLHQHYESITDN